MPQLGETVTEGTITKWHKKTGDLVAEDEVLFEAARQTDTDQRAKTYGKAISLVHKDDPIIYLYRQRNLTAYSEDIAGIATYADGVVRLSRAAFLEES